MLSAGSAGLGLASRSLGGLRAPPPHTPRNRGNRNTASRQQENRMEQPAPLDGTEWQEITKGNWFCGVYRYRFDFEAIIRLNENGQPGLSPRRAANPIAKIPATTPPSPALRRKCGAFSTSLWRSRLCGKSSAVLP